MGNTSMAQKVPPRTILEVFESLPEGTLCELIDNKIVMPPAPSYEHQGASKIIFRQLDAFVVANDLGDVQYAPVDVYLGKENVFQPDLLFIAKERLDIVQKGKVRGAPDLVIEILSPGNENYDRNEKRKVYERFGAKEYWLVNKDTKQVTGYSLHNNIFVEIPSQPGVIASRLLNASIRF